MIEVFNKGCDTSELADLHLFEEYERNKNGEKLTSPPSGGPKYLGAV